MDNKTNQQVIVVTSGKGGTGKSTVAINLAMALTDLGNRVLVLDANLELPSIATLLNIIPINTITDLIEERKSIHEVILNDPQGIKFILGSALPKPMIKLSNAHHFGVINTFNDISNELDILIIDTAPGIDSSTVNFIHASKEVLFVITNEPTAIASANATINTLHKTYKLCNFRILINRVYNIYEGKKAFDSLQKMNIHNTEIFLTYAGHIHEHRSARIAATKGQPLYKMFPKSLFSQDIKKIADLIDTWPIRESPTGRIEFFGDDLIKKSSRLYRQENKTKKK